MDNDRVNEVLLSYDGKLASLGYMIERRPPEEPLPENDHAEARRLALQHARWMAREALSWPAERLEKKFRWLGFVQCALWMGGVSTVESLKRDNMPPDETYRP